jgi:type IV secretory pathway ATPase VirB11/archaellum biosynthesis ATPase
MGLVPIWMRFITIQDSAELRRLPHPNKVQMYFDKEGKGAGVRAMELVEMALRMRIGRLMIQEISDGETAMALLLLLQTGHKGVITTIHAPHCHAVFDRLKVLVKLSGVAVSDEDIISEFREMIDIIVHNERGDGPFEADEIYFKECA